MAYLNQFFHTIGMRRFVSYFPVSPLGFLLLLVVVAGATFSVFAEAYAMSPDHQRYGIAMIAQCTAKSRVAQADGNLAAITGYHHCSLESQRPRTLWMISGLGAVLTGAVLVYSVSWFQANRHRSFQQPRVLNFAGALWWTFWIITVAVILFIALAWGRFFSLTATLRLAGFAVLLYRARYYPFSTAKSAIWDTLQIGVGTSVMFALLLVTASLVVQPEFNLVLTGFAIVPTSVLVVYALGNQIWQNQRVNHQEDTNLTIGLVMGGGMLVGHYLVRTIIPFVDGPYALTGASLIFFEIIWAVGVVVSGVLMVQWVTLFAKIRFVATSSHSVFPPIWIRIAMVVTLGLWTAVLFWGWFGGGVGNTIVAEDILVALRRDRQLMTFLTLANITLTLPLIYSVLVGTGIAILLTNPLTFYGFLSLWGLPLLAHECQRRAEVVSHDTPVLPDSALLASAPVKWTLVVVMLAGVVMTTVALTLYALPQENVGFMQWLLIGPLAISVFCAQPLIALGSAYFAPAFRWIHALWATAIGGILLTCFTLAYWLLWMVVAYQQSANPLILVLGYLFAPLIGWYLGTLLINGGGLFAVPLALAIGFIEAHAPRDNDGRVIPLRTEFLPEQTKGVIDKGNRA